MEAWTANKINQITADMAAPECTEENNVRIKRIFTWIQILTSTNMVHPGTNTPDNHRPAVEQISHIQ